MSETLFDLHDPSMERYAHISDDGVYRYTLHRAWDYELPEVAWIMLNPSTADALADDPTIRRCIAFSRSWGYGQLVVVNLFALRATDPAALRSFAPNDPVGPLNNEHLFAQATTRPTICAWGASVPDYWRHRPTGVVKQLRERGAELYHLGLTKDRHPKHPLYLRADTPMTRWDR